jgi:predicted nucleic acid-binding protein
LSKATKKFLVVDAWVLGTASANPKSDIAWKAADVLARILYICHKVVLDLQEQVCETILEEYERQAKSEVARRWLIAIQSKPDKVVCRPRADIAFPALSDSDDLKYLQIAVNSPHKIIISEDSDLTSIADHPQITDAGIRIWTLNDALSNL